MKPENEEALAGMIRAAPGPLHIQGGGTRGVGKLREDAQTIETTRLSGIVDYEPGALTLVVRAGTPLAGVEAALAAENQRLAFEPPDLRGLLRRRGVSTIGGVVAANASGPRRIAVGAARDFLLGVRFVDGTGTVLRNGGRVMKNVTGYDLVRLLAGSRGTLGVMTEVSLKVLPASAAAAMLRCDGLDDAAAIAALSRALGSPYEVSGAAHLQRGKDGAAATLIRLEGSEMSMAYRAGALRDVLAPHGAFDIERNAARIAAEWARIRDVTPFEGREGDVWRLSVKPSDAPGIVARLGGEAIYDWGGGLVWLLLPEGLEPGAVRAAVAAAGGHATLFRATAAARDIPAFPPQPAALARIEAGLRARFDPRGILNPGLMG